ncbi:branched-chain-amino-acid transaminase [Thermoflavimicrobium daqui]|jgi:branched-chain amino acid aminotransferase|uniref:Branched-chain-amino-acid aminotransferase n=1 Tax=Thermoflavimicrobium daqui TaxID=2137476 RepID=A0A364K6Z2_9BACL|nr:branched-chain-amino-acid transaminase [Thermoflavimicrobium daqui]RAL26064.1 branched-chain-amino-acid transaminase [Thermoflavimicrobium daqui]
MKEYLVYINGNFVPRSQATVSVFDHGFLYGDGIFEGIRSYEGNVFCLREHIKRLYESAKSILLDIPMTPKEMEEAIVETLQRNSLANAYIRVIVSRGNGDLGLDPRSCIHPNVIIIAEALAIFPKEFYEKGLRIATVPTRRNIPDALNPKIKSLNYLNNILIKLEATQAGVFEALTLTQDGYVCEGSGDNVFIVKNGKIITPPTYLGALEGITRNIVIELCENLGIPCKEEPFTRHDVYVADEIFLTGTAAEMIPVIEVDSRIIGEGKPGPVTKQIITEFRKQTKVRGTKVPGLSPLTA